MNFLAGAAAGTEIGTSIGNLVLSGLQFANQQKVQAQQLALLNKQLDLSQKQLEINQLTQDPIALYTRALHSGFDPVSARQLAGSHEARYLGNVSLPPLDHASISGLTHSSSRLAQITINKSYNQPKPGSEPVLLGYRPLRSHGGTVSSLPSTVDYNSLPWRNRPGTVSSAASTVNYDSLPWKQRPRIPSFSSQSVSTVNYDSLPWTNRPTSV
nr:putative minor structural protein [Bat sapovirus]